ncbi:hypothetical protein SLEP1_g5605 [Rubroshorea leprosula]|uniref:Uncharacterized protein n=1 Tax=Rubroshorea leprosula TaxID=152421 RepID=A0AAV5HYC2_9ROSI|nr:hypothetical protein SLEP1_g5605 [Rubroshorea leprosula]
MREDKTLGEKPSVRIPPPRGQVKVRMYKVVVKKIKSAVSMAGRGKKEDGAGSSSTTPNPSGCTSEKNSDS